MNDPKHHDAPYEEISWLTGHLLIAMPTMADPRFVRAVIYICSHGPHGAMGLVINQLMGETDFHSLLGQLGIPTSDVTPDLPVHMGGPVEQGRGFVLHSPDYRREGTGIIDEHVSLSSSIDILHAMADGGGPDKALMALGYTGWGAGQLDAEMMANGWLTAPADGDILFGEELDTKWERALAKIGISPMVLSGDAGHA